MKTITIRLPDVETAMLVEVQKVNKDLNYFDSLNWGAKLSLAAGQLLAQAKQQLGISKIAKAMLAQSGKQPLKAYRISNQTCNT